MLGLGTKVPTFRRPCEGLALLLLLSREELLWIAWPLEAIDCLKCEGSS